MAANWADHFGQYYDLADMLQGTWAEIDNWTISIANPPRAGACHVRGVNGGAGAMRRPIGSSKTVEGLATRNYVNNLPHLEPETPAGISANAGCCIRSWLSATNVPQFTTFIGTDGALVCYRGAAIGTAGWAPIRVYRSAQCIFPKTYHHIEDRITVNGSTGNYELRVDGVTRINVGGIDTDPVGTGEVSQVAWEIFDATGAGINVTMDVADAHAWDDLEGEGPVDFVGNAAVLQRAFNQDTADADWILSTGSSGFTLLTDKSTATYIDAPSIGQKSGFLAAAAPTGTIPVYQQLSWRGLKTDGSDCNVAPGFKVSGVEAELPGQPSQMGEVWHWGIQATDPDTSGAPFSEASMNATEFTFTRTL